MPELDPELRETIDRWKINDVLTRYCRALDRCDLELMKQVYWPDAIDDHGISCGNAHEFAEMIIREIAVWFEMAMHAITNVHIEIDGDVAYTEAYLISYCKVKGDAKKIADVFGSTYLKQLGTAEVAGGHDFLYGGRYVDRLERRDGVWRIAKRKVLMDWNRSEPSRDIWNEGMFAALSSHGRRDRKDACYQASDRTVNP
jgi:ketosteroid isomerase-like protein